MFVSCCNEKNGICRSCIDRVDMCPFCRSPKVDSFEFNEMSEELSDDWFDGYDEIAIKENRKWLGLMKEFRKKYVKSVMTWNGA